MVVFGLLFGTSLFLDAANLNVNDASPDENKKACDSGDARGCGNLGLQYMAGKGVRKNLTKAKMLLEKSCNKNEFNGCAILGFMYMGAEGQTRIYLEQKNFLSRLAMADQV